MRPASFLLFAALSTSACMLCPSGATLGEKAVPVCDSVTYDEMNGRSYNLVRIQGEMRTRSRFTFNLEKNCDVKPPEDLSHLGVESIFIVDPRSNPRVVLRTTRKNAEDEPIDCDGPLSESDAVALSCPAGGEDLSYLLEPL
jgi:hypothetical protein